MKIFGIRKLFFNFSKKPQALFALLLSLLFLSVLVFTRMNDGFYLKTIAQVVSITSSLPSQVTDSFGNSESVSCQNVTAIIKNGAHRGETISFQNFVSATAAIELPLRKGDKIFVDITEDNGRIFSSKLLDLKRDTSSAAIMLLFVAFILVIGGRKGTRSLLSAGVNILLFAGVMQLYYRGFPLVLTSAVAAVPFIFLSILLVAGRNRKALSAIVGTVVGTSLSMLIALSTLHFTGGNGIHYEQMEFLIRDPEQIFLSELLLGTLGGIMDIAISISSAVSEMIDSDPDISRTALIHSGFEIGRDIMGAMANTLVFAYLSGSIPMVLLWLKNGFLITGILSVNLSLEITRALVGSIGIVLSIPVTLYLSVLLLRRGRHESVAK